MFRFGISSSGFGAQGLEGIGLRDFVLTPFSVRPEVSERPSSDETGFSGLGFEAYRV